MRWLANHRNEWALVEYERMAAMTSDDLMVDPVVLREQVKKKYREVADTPDAEFHFHTGRRLAARCGYDSEGVDALPDAAVESFAGVANPFALRSLQAGERVVDVGSGAGLDSFLAARSVGPEGRVVGVEMTPEMLARARRTANELDLANVEFRNGLAEDLPVEDGWADVVIANGVLNLVADKRRAFAEIWRVLPAGGVLQFADIATGHPVPEDAIRDIDLWTA
jgi:arsenite methyltransferase